MVTRQRNIIPFPQAADLLRALQPCTATEWVDLGGAAGRFAAQTVRAPVALPRAPRSAMDGFAVRCADLRAKPWTPSPLRLVGAVRAGEPAPPILFPGTCLGVATGALLPTGADAVVPVEAVSRGGRRIVILRAASPGDNIVAPGEEGRSGDTLIPAGARIGSRHLVALAAEGYSRLLVRRPLRVALVATGDEVVVPGMPLAEGQVYESSGLALQAELVAAGMAVDMLPPCPDRAPDMLYLFRRILSAGSYDAVVTTGGVSVGDRDLVPRAWEMVGAEPLLDGVAVKPGKALFAARAGRITIFSLSGNPHAALASYYTLIRPGLTALAGGHPQAPLPGRLVQEARGRGDRTSLLWAEPWRETGWWRALTGLSILESLVRASALLVLAPGEPRRPPGTLVDVILLGSGGGAPAVAQQPPAASALPAALQPGGAA